MTDGQKFAWTIAFGGLYLIAGIRACNWLTGQLGDLNTMLQVFILPFIACLLYTSPSPRDRTRSRMPSSA